MSTASGLDTQPYAERESDIMLDIAETDTLIPSQTGQCDRKPNPFDDPPRASVDLPTYDTAPVGLVRSTNMSLSGQQEEWVLALQDVQDNINSLRVLRGKNVMNTFLVKVDSLFNTNIAPFALSLMSKKHRGVPGTRDVSESGVLSRQQEIRIHEELILAGMHRLAAIHPDAVQRAEWGLREAQFARALEIGAAGSDDLEDNTKKKESILAGIGKGLGIIVLTPVVLAGAALFGAGAVAYGTGKFLVGLGHVATCGKFR